MGFTAGLEFEFDHRQVDGQVPSAAVMVDVQYVGVLAGDERQQTGQGPGHIPQLDPHPHDAPALGQPPADNPTQKRAVQVAPAYHQDRPVPLGELDRTAHQRCQRGGTGAFGHDFLAFHEQQNRGGNAIFVDTDDLVHLGTNDFEGGLPDLPDIDPVGD